MLHWFLPLGSLQTRGGNFTVWFYTHDNSIRKSDKGMGMGFRGMRRGWHVTFLFRPDFLFVWVCYPTGDKKSPRQDLKSHVQSWNEMQTAKQHCIWLCESFPREKAFWLEHFVPVISLWLISLPNSDPSHPSPASPALPERGVHPGHARLPSGHWVQARKLLFPHHAHSTCCQHSLTFKRDLRLIWALRSQEKQRMWLQSSSLSEQDSWNGIQLISVGLICSYRVNRVQGVLLRYFKYIFPWMLQKRLYNYSPSGK